MKNRSWIYLLTFWAYIAASLIPFKCFAEEFSKEDFPLYSGLDTYEMKISTNSEEAQKYFNQGLLLFYGYNYPEAARAFKAAYLLDPNCAMCYWGACLALCDCADHRGDKWHREAYYEYEKAKEHFENTTEKEKELIRALAVKFKGKYSENETPSSLFCDNMRDLHKKYPNDPDIAAIFSNSGTKTVDLFRGIRDDNPYGYAEIIIEAMEETMKKYPNHPGLNHFYIHAMEGAGTPEKALTAAENLDGRVPGSGHLEHMPAHIYFLYGRYHDATRTNQSGIDADNRMFENGGLKNPEFAGFYLHNYYFLFDSLMMEGRSKEAVKAAQDIARRLKNGELPSNPQLKDVYYGIPSLLMARAGMWDKISEAPPIPKNFIFANAMRTYALGLAALREGNVREARQELQILKGASSRYEKRRKKGGHSASLAKIMQIAALDLGGQIDAAMGNRQKQIESLTKALEIEDTLYFHMLPWYLYMRHALGDALLAANRPVEAEKIYREDLKKHPHNGWALYGLVKSLEMQNKQHDANQYRKEFNDAWQYADLQLTSSRF